MNSTWLILPLISFMLLLYSFTTAVMYLSKQSTFHCKMKPMFWLTRAVSKIWSQIIFLFFSLGRLHTILKLLWWLDVLPIFSFFILCGLSWIRMPLFQSLWHSSLISTSSPALGVYFPFCFLRKTPIGSKTQWTTKPRSNLIFFYG